MQDAKRVHLCLGPEERLMEHGAEEAVQALRPD